jgi:hypothetical protein
MAVLKCHRAVQHENLTFVASLLRAALWKRFQARGNCDFRLADDGQVITCSRNGFGSRRLGGRELRFGREAFQFEATSFL